MNGWIAILAAYLIGGIPFGYLLVRLKTGEDVRAKGSGNIGATNVMRTTGRSLGTLTLALDIAKGFLAVWLAGMITGGAIEWTSAAAAAVMIGHAFPVFLRFHGGKAVASFLGAFLYLAPLAVLATVTVFVVVVWRTRYVSLGSILGAAAFPLAVWLILHPPAPLLLSAAFGGLLVIARHHGNIARLRAGKENKLGGRRS
ncbi:MAG TPA: glycerol-3-phosphate 1-O-acyltransferase PlsY [Bryobacteraceae bacterium]|nr:glycerol-3-phosphate 1-O-acyltransferase PlsY [Bryobacteraceae bacterium]